MPSIWSKKDERQYQHVKDSELDQGRSDDRAEEIAARTVNKQRHEEGRTKEQQSAQREARRKPSGQFGPARKAEAGRGNKRSQNNAKKRATRAKRRSRAKSRRKG
jgi:hypothetical protein